MTFMNFVIPTFLAVFGLFAGQSYARGIVENRFLGYSRNPVAAEVAPPVYPARPPYDDFYATRPYNHPYGRPGYY